MPWGSPLTDSNLLNCDFIYVYESAASNLDPLDGNVIQNPYEGLTRSFIRGDINEDRTVNQLDIDLLMNSFECPVNPCGMNCENCIVACAESTDANDSGTSDLSTDVLFLNNFLYMMGPPPPPPFPTCGKDPTTDGLSCGTLSSGGTPCNQ